MGARNDCADSPLQVGFGDANATGNRPGWSLTRRVPWPESVWSRSSWPGRARTGIRPGGAAQAQQHHLPVLLLAFWRCVALSLLYCRWKLQDLTPQRVKNGFSFFSSVARVPLRGPLLALSAARKLPRKASGKVTTTCAVQSTEGMRSKGRSKGVTYSSGAPERQPWHIPAGDGTEISPADFCPPFAPPAGAAGARGAGGFAPRPHRRPWHRTTARHGVQPLQGGGAPERS